jgi:hypothetical protein
MSSIYQIHGLSLIKDKAVISCDHYQLTIARRNVMSMNVGTIDQYVRIVVGLALVAYAFRDGVAIQGWHWAGLIGFVILLTAFFRRCPAYSMLGISTCKSRSGRTT